MQMFQKIGILTFQNTMNYGAVLQSYALQRYLHSIGIEADIIDYRNTAIEKRESPSKISIKCGIKKWIKYILYHGGEKRKRANIDLFIKENLKKSSAVFWQSENPDFNDYDSVIVGSDQVWNTLLTDNDLKYFLKDVSVTKYSYAASCGLENSIDSEKTELLKDFKRISVREKSLQIELKKWNINAEETLDPTFLLDKNEWAKLIAPDLVCKDYVLLYQMTNSASLFSFAKKLAKENNCILLNANPIGTQVLKSRTKMDASPFEWLSLIARAKFVVTNSFHGVAFSINMNKEFYTEIAENETHSTSRLQSLLDIFQLNHRAIKEVNATDYKPIDYSEVNELLDINRCNSCKFLNSIKEELYVL